MMSFAILLAHILLAGCGKATALPNRESTSAQAAEISKWFTEETVAVHMVMTRAQAPQNFEAGVYIDMLHAWMRTPQELLQTSDGGKSWFALRPAPDAEAAFGRLDQMSPGRLFFSDPQRGFFSTDRGIWKTDDAGSTWKLVSRGSFSHLHFFDRDRGWMYFSIESDSHTYVQAHRTFDGGRTWRPCGPLADRKINNDDDASGNSDYVIHTAAFPDDHTGWGIATKSLKRNRTDGVFRTDDGGCSWTLVWENLVNAIDPDESFWAVHFTDQDYGWMGGSMFGGVYGTSNGGRSWVVLANSAYVPPVEGLYFRNHDEGWLVATSDQETPMMHTANGGRSWTPMHSQEIVDANLPEGWKLGRFIQLLAKSKSRTN